MCAGAVLLLQQHREPLCQPESGPRLLLRSAARLLPLNSGGTGSVQGEGAVLFCGGRRVQHGDGLHRLYHGPCLVDAQVQPGVTHSPCWHDVACITVQCGTAHAADLHLSPWTRLHPEL